MTDGPTSEKKLGKAVRVLLIAVILACAGTIASYWLSHRPRAERKPPQASTALEAALASLRQA